MGFKSEEMMAEEDLNEEIVILDEQEICHDLGKEEEKELAKVFHATVPEEKRTELSSLENSVKIFKTLRVKMEYSQTEIADILVHRFGREYSQTTISRYENMNLSLKQMREITNYLTIWLSEKKNGERDDDPTKMPRPLPPPGPRRRPRTCYTREQKLTLERYFSMKNKPTPDELKKIAEEVGHDKEAIRFWFNNKRQTENKKCRNISSSSYKKENDDEVM